MMPTTDTLDKTHYEYLNEWLANQQDETLKAIIMVPGEDIEAQLLERVKAQLNDEIKQLMALQEEETQQRKLKKMQECLAILEDESKKKAYDASLKSPLQLQVGNDVASRVRLLATVPVEDIVSAFELFKSELLALKDPEGKPIYQESDFTVTQIPGNPPVYVFKCPSAETRDAFISRLFTNNLATFPNGSQDMAELPKHIEPMTSTNHHAFKKARETLGTIRESLESENTTSAITPLPTSLTREK